MLRTCFTHQSDTLYGTLSHSHLLLVLLAMKTRAPWPWPPAWYEIFNGTGVLGMAAVAAKDESLSRLLTTGLSMEVLSWKVNTEESNACSLIYQALNAGHNLALRTPELTALAVLTGATTLELESAVAARVSFETVQARVRQELDMLVDQPDFVDVFEFVVNMGANKNSIIPQFVACWGHVR